MFSLEPYDRKLKNFRKVFNQIISGVGIDILGSYAEIKIENAYKSVFISRLKSIHL